MKRAIFVCVLVILMICGCVTAVALTQQEEKATVASSTNYSVGSYRDVTIAQSSSKTFSVARPIIDPTYYGGYQCSKYHIINDKPTVSRLTYAYAVDTTGKARTKKRLFMNTGIYSLEYIYAPVLPYPDSYKLKLVVQNDCCDFSSATFYSFESSALWSPNGEAFGIEYQPPYA